MTIEEEVWEQHARECAFLWLLRDRAVRDPGYDLPALIQLDGRLEANLDGLRLAGDGGFEACKALLQKPEGGEVFAAAVIAIERSDLEGLAEVLDVGGEAPDLARGLVSALGWLPLEQVERLLPGLLDPDVPPPLTWIGIAACAAHRHNPGPPLGYAVLSSDLRVRARAVRAAGELGRTDLHAEVRDAMGSEDPLCRFWAAWSATLFGDESASRVLWDFARGDGPFRERAVTIGIRRADPRTAVTWAQTLANGGDMRVAIRAAAGAGDPQLVPWLIEAARVEEHARLAGAAITLITGVDLRAEKLHSERPKGHMGGPNDNPDDEDVSMDPDEFLPWPNPDRIADWWKRHGGTMRRSTRHLLGKPVTPEWLEEVVRRGNQEARAVAAMEMSLARRGRTLFEVRAPGSAQAAQLRC